MQHLSEDLGTELPERAYGEDCALNVKNLRETVFDEFVLAHVIGWFAKFFALSQIKLSFAGGANP